MVIKNLLFRDDNNFNVQGFIDSFILVFRTVSNKLKNVNIL